MNELSKIKSDSNCVGGYHRPATKNSYGDKTSKGSKAKCQIKKSMTVSDNTIQTEGLGVFFKNLGNEGMNVSKKSNPGRTLDLTAKIATAAVSKISKQVLSTLPELIITTQARVYI